MFQKIFNYEYKAVVISRIYFCMYNNILKRLNYILCQQLKCEYNIVSIAKISKNFKLIYIGGIVIDRNLAITDNCTIHNNISLSIKNSVIVKVVKKT